MKASLEQRIDCQVKCDRSVEFCATKREPEVKTTTTTKEAVAKSIWKMCKKMQPNRFLESKPNPKKPNLFLEAELLLLTEHLQRNPTYEKGKERPLPAQGTR